MSRRLLLPCLLFLPALAAAAPKHNLVAIVTDDQAAWTIGCYGGNEISTPNLDRIAKDGARFENAFVHTPVCSPSRGTYLTGLFPSQLGYTDW
ncbi:MAG: sulfatase-like hydrolase/transferase, partial [Verrucomicrobiae bacterium]|nr:sulfatase-like hydrolase/transferase [Verrucomicrobiae bacterium]